MNASVYYDDGRPPVAKFTKKGIHSTVRQCQRLLWMFVHVRVYMSVYPGQRSWWAYPPLIREDHHLREHILFLFVLPSARCRMAHYTSWVVCSGVGLCVRVCTRTHSRWWTSAIDWPGSSVKLATLQGGERDIVERNCQQPWCEKVKLTLQIKNFTFTRIQRSVKQSLFLSMSYLNSLLSLSNPLSAVRFTSKPPFGFGGFSAPVMDLFPTVLTFFYLVGWWKYWLVGSIYCCWMGARQSSSHLTTVFCTVGVHLLTPG